MKYQDKNIKKQSLRKAKMFRKQDFKKIDLLGSGMPCLN